MSIYTFRAMGQLLGYARASTSDQDVQLRPDALTKAGRYRIFTDAASGPRESRPELDKRLDRSAPWTLSWTGVLAVSADPSAT